MKEELTEYLSSNEINLDEAHVNKVVELHNAAIKSVETDAFGKVDERVNGTLDGAAKAVFSNLGLEFNRGDKRHSEAIVEGLQSYITGSVSEKETKIKELQSLIDGKPDADKLRAEIESQIKGDTSKHIKSLEKEWQTKLDKKDQDMERFIVKSSFSSSMPNFDSAKISAIGQTNFDLIKNNAVDAIMSDYEFLKRDSGYVPHKNHIDHELSEILKNHPSLSPFVAEEHSQKGTGADEAQVKKNKHGITSDDPIEQAEQAKQKLISQGLKQGTSEYAKAFTEIMKELN